MDTDARAEASPQASSAHPTDNSGFEGTGDSRVDEQLQVLETLPGRPVAEHVEVFETVHRTLSDIMSTIDSGTDDAVDNPSSGPAAR